MKHGRYLYNQKNQWRFIMKNPIFYILFFSMVAAPCASVLSIDANWHYDMQHDQMLCGVCVQPVEIDWPGTFALPCEHGQQPFHTSCMQQWLAFGQDSCPLCDAVFTEQQQILIAQALSEAMIDAQIDQPTYQQDVRDDRHEQQVQQEMGDCAICFEQLNDQWPASVTLHCTAGDHSFCLGCIEQWVETGAQTCPLCRWEMSALDKELLGFARQFINL